MNEVHTGKERMGGVEAEEKEERKNFKEGVLRGKADDP